MARIRQLSKAPVREALIDIQFESPVPIEVVHQVAERTGGTFEKSSPIWEAIVGLNIGADGTHEASSNSSARGVRLDSTSPPHVIQYRTNGFAFSRLPPYTTWEGLRDAAKEAWENLVRATSPFFINRLAVRYINEIALPIPFHDFSEYLECPPEVPEGLPQAVGAFLQRVIIPDDQFQCVSIITQALEDQSSIVKDSVTIVLDVDVHRRVHIESGNSEAIWTALEELRMQKNRMFFGHITEKTAEIYE
jgi:uncharacterized protein (TIGR04255 family)